jgi:hypothetical protein
MRFKNLFPLIAIVLLLTAQSSQAQEFKFGLKNGLNLSVFQGSFKYTEEDVDLEFDSKITLRYAFGTMARFEFNPHFSIQTELLYNSKGTRLDEDIELNNQNVNINGGVVVNYIEIPLFLRFSTRLPHRATYFYPIPGFTYNFYIGGYYGFNVRSKFRGLVSGDIVGPTLNEEFENDIRTLLKKEDYGAVAGLGFEYGLYTKFVFDIRYAHGMNDIGNDPVTNLSLKNGVLSASIGVMF